MCHDVKLAQSNGTDPKLQTHLMCNKLLVVETEPRKVLNKVLYGMLHPEVLTLTLLHVYTTFDQQGIPFTYLE